MKRIAVTQRVLEHNAYPERRDALDQRWPGILEQAGILALPMPNCISDVHAWLRSISAEGLLLTSGNDLSILPNAADPAPERDQTERSALEYFREQDLPVLGVCRGCQLLAVEAGAQLGVVEGHIAVYHEIAAEGLSFPSKVNSYHGLQIDPASVPDNLQIAARSPDGVIEAIVQPEIRRLGIMWHPEREKEPDPADVALLCQWFGVD